MRTFTAGELSRLRSTQSGAMQDTCKRLVYSQTGDTHGNPVATYTAGAEQACGFESVKPNELQASGEVPAHDARVRLPLTVTLDPRDRIQITKRYGESITAETYNIIGPVQRGPSGLVVMLKLVTK